MSYITLRGRFCGMIVLNVHVPNEDTSDDYKGERLQRTGVSAGSVPEVPHKNYFRRLQCKRREEINFQTNNQE
jgi:hypothetical protein